MRLGKRWLLRLGVFTLSTQASLAFTQDNPIGTRESSIAVAAVTPIPNETRQAIVSEPIAHASVSRAVHAATRPGFESAPLPSFTLLLAAPEIPRSAPLAWASIVHASFAGVNEDEYRALSMTQIAVLAVPPAHRPNFIERGFDATIGSLDWSVRSLMRRIRGYPFDGNFDPTTDEQSLTDSFLSIVERPTRQDGSFNTFVNNLLKLEAKFFQRFEGSYLNPVSVELGYNDFDETDILEEQFKVVFDAVLRTLVERSGYEDMSRRVGQEGLDVWRYRGKDYYILPPVIGALVYYRGLDYRMKIHHTKVRIQIAPAYEIIDTLNDRDYLVGAIGLEVNTPIKGIKILTFAGLKSGRMELDFVGIGTDLEIARKALAAAFEE